MVVSVLAATKLWQHGRHFTFDQMETGKYWFFSIRGTGRQFHCLPLVLYDTRAENQPYPM